MNDLLTMNLPTSIESGLHRGGHCQGIAVDVRKGCVYYSFTTRLVKMDLQGNLIGSVTGLTGHLGCIALCPEDGRVYGSLEYKMDAIGKGILKALGSDGVKGDAFYVAMFDGDAITRPDMDACRDGVMTTVYLDEVVRDYQAEVCVGGQMLAHRLGCSGIDGITFGPVPGEAGEKQLLFVAYGVYDDVTRPDNDHQVILAYDTRGWRQYEQPLSQDVIHRCGPDAPTRKFFVYTGNTTYGVQNLEYDAHSGHFLMAVYPGKKPTYPNYPMYVIDGQTAPRRETLRGMEPAQDGELLALWSADDEGETPGFRFAYGSTGLCALGNGLYYVSHDYEKDGCFGTTLRLYRWNGCDPLAWIEAE